MNTVSVVNNADFRTVRLFPGTSPRSCTGPEEEETGTACSPLSSAPGQCSTARVGGNEVRTVAFGARNC